MAEPERYSGHHGALRILVVISRILDARELLARADIRAAVKKRKIPWICFAKSAAPPACY